MFIEYMQGDTPGKHCKADEARGRCMQVYKARKEEDFLGGIGVIGPWDVESSTAFTHSDIRLASMDTG
jgi:hypothetical protein